MATLPRSSAAYSAKLRLELCERARDFSRQRNLVCELSYGSSPVVAFTPQGDRHGNFFDPSYRSILAAPFWKRRLSKVHTSDSLPRTDRRWSELDSCNSSDALLMNIFCCPDLWHDSRLPSLLGVNPSIPEFGFRPRVPLLHGQQDRTEVDMRIGDLFVESKLTEADFQSKGKAYLERYRDFEKVFRRSELPRSQDIYGGYQLIRNVLAAYAHEYSFCVMLDARRPDLLEQWYAVMRAVRVADLRTRCKVLTWQELSEALPDPLQSFLDCKYGIRPGPLEPYTFEHQRDL